MGLVSRVSFLLFKFEKWDNRHYFHLLISLFYFIYLVRKDVNHGREVVGLQVQFSKTKL